MLKKSRSKVLNIAHRGARSLAPENTLAAARKALDCGADMWELDVGMTADGVLILIHDDTLTRTSNASEIFPERAPWDAYQFTLAEIRRLDFGSWFNDEDPFGQIAAGQVLPADLDSFIGEIAPTLEEALAFTRDHDWRVNVEIKDLSRRPGDADVVEKVVALVEEMSMTDRVLISSFNFSYLERVKAANPNLATAALVRQAPSEPLKLLHRLEAQAYHPHVTAITTEAIVDFRTEGFEVSVWTVNDEETMRSLIEAKASGIITDFPQMLRSLLRK